MGAIGGNIHGVLTFFSIIEYFGSRVALGVLSFGYAGMGMLQMWADRCEVCQVGKLQREQRQQRCSFELNTLLATIIVSLAACETCVAASAVCLVFSPWMGFR